MALVTRAEVVAFAKITVALTADQEAIVDGFIAAALPEIERVTGPLDLRSEVYRCGARSGALVLPWRYVSVTSITVDGSTVDASSYDDVTRAASGIVDPANGYVPWSTGVVVVNALVGSVSTPPNVKLAALELCASWWQQTQQAQRAAWSEGGVPMGFGMPQRVLDHLLASPDLPGFA
jgi:hypothetical protein